MILSFEVRRLFEVPSQAASSNRCQKKKKKEEDQLIMRISDKKYPQWDWVIKNKHLKDQYSK